MKIALAQCRPRLGDKSANLKLHRELVTAAGKKGADLVVFPELSLNGYLLQDLVREVAEPVKGGPALKKLAGMSRKAGVIAGFAERGNDGQCYNAAGTFISGRLMHVHRKVYLPTYGMFDEGRYFAPGDSFTTYDAPWGRTGVIICEDFWHLSSSYLLALQGMDLLVVISASPVKGMTSKPRLRSAEIWSDLGRVVARHFSCWVAYVNRTGYEDGWAFQGGSYIVSPTGEAVAEGRLLDDDLVVATLPASRLRKARIESPMMRDEKPDLVKREMERILGGQLQRSSGASNKADR
jgi:predicted amidohydrolase